MTHDHQTLKQTVPLFHVQKDIGFGKMPKENGIHIVEKQMPRSTDVMNGIESQLLLSQFKIRSKKSISDRSVV